MASRRNLKKKITNIASDLFLVSLMEGVNREVVCNSVHNVIKLIIRISHTEPGNVKGFYKKLNEDLNKEIKVVANEQLTNQQKAESENANKSSNNYLSSLEVEGYRLLPEFDKQIQEYTLDSDTKEDNVTIKAIADDKRANITGTGNIKLQTGENNLRVDVSAENGTVRTYFIKVTRKIQDETLRLSSIKLNAVDQNGNKDEVDLSPSFSENVFSYTAKIYNGASKIDVDTSCLNENAKITVEGNENLKDGKNTIIITVSKEGKTETVSYKIDVIKESSRETSGIPTDKKDNKTAICVIMVLAVIVIFMLLTRKKNRKH